METSKLIEVYLMHRWLIKTGKKRLKEIRDPKRRIIHTVNMVNIVIDLTFLEQELCDKIILPFEYIVQDQ
jgi:hypothetical protein